MKNEISHDCQRLPITFHRTFFPERIYLNAIIKFAASDSEGTDQEISAVTGIPVGRSDGKVPAIISYAQGMNLITCQSGSLPGSKKLALTDFGRSVLLEDAFLSSELTQWLAHAHLCRAIGGAEVWHQVFALGTEVLGTQFTEQRVEGFLIKRLGKRNRSLTGPLLRMYAERASFGGADILVGEQGVYQKKCAPWLRHYKLPYTAYFLSLWENHFEGALQVSLDDFESQTFWSNIFGWGPKESEIVLRLIQSTGAIRLDTHIWPYAMIRIESSKDYWRRIYDDAP